jgi:thiamine-phosphate pyrophosphorylase
VAGGRSELRARVADARLYLCMDARERQGDLAGFLDAVLAAGVDVVQLRQKGMEARAELAALEVVGAACARHGRLLAVNDRADIAFAARPRPDILHLGQDDLPAAAARQILGENILLGRSTHAEEEVDAARVEAETDYYCVGPVWPTPTKPGRPAPGLDLLSYAAAREPAGPPRPWFAIGGIDLRNLDEVLARGARRVVVVRAITEAADPPAAVAEFARRLRAAG